MDNWWVSWEWVFIVFFRGNFSALRRCCGTICLMKQSLDAKTLRDIEPEKGEEIKNKLDKNPVYLVLESVYDTYNIGGLFRLADSLAVKGMYLCNDTETPPNPRIAKASIGTYKIVPWFYKETVKEALKEIKRKEGEVFVVGVEQAEHSHMYTDIEYKKPTVLIVGNETTGVSKETLALCNAVAEIPMWGVNKSLNVIVSAAIVAYEVMRRFQDSEK